VDEKVGSAKLISDEDTTKNEDAIGAGQREESRLSGAVLRHASDAECKTAKA